MKKAALPVPYRNIDCSIDFHYEQEVPHQRKWKLKKDRKKSSSIFISHTCDLMIYLKSHQFLEASLLHLCTLYVHKVVQCTFDEWKLEEAPAEEEQLNRYYCKMHNLARRLKLVISHHTLMNRWANCNHKSCIIILCNHMQLQAGLLTHGPINSRTC